MEKTNGIGATQRYYATSTKRKEATNNKENIEKSNNNHDAILAAKADAEAKINLALLNLNNSKQTKTCNIKSNQEIKEVTLTEKRYHENGEVAVEEYSDGSVKWWNKNGELTGIKTADDTTVHWYDNGQVKIMATPDGVRKEWDKNGQLKEVHRLLNREKGWRGGYTLERYKNGQLWAERTLDGTIIKYENGRAVKVIHP